MIQFKNTSFSYGNVAALNRITLEIKNEFVGVIGPTGSGKSTLLSTLNGIIPKSIRGKFTGDVTVNNKNTRKHSVAELARTVGFVFQEPDNQLFADTVRDEVLFGVRNLQLSEKNADRAMKKVSITNLAERSTHALSEGQKQKVCIASVLAMHPDIIALDEPTSRLDYRSTLEIYALLSALHKKGKTIIVVEHKPEMLAKHATRILVLDKGSIVADGTPKKIFSNTKLLNHLGLEIPVTFRRRKK